MGTPIKGGGAGVTHLNSPSPVQPERSVSLAGRMMKEKLDRLVNKENQQHVQEVSSMQAMLEETLTQESPLTTRSRTHVSGGGPAVQTSSITDQAMRRRA